MRGLNSLSQLRTRSHCKFLSFSKAAPPPTTTLGSKRCLSAYTEDPEMRDVMEYLESLKNYEKSGVPKGAGTDSGEGFDLGRMRRLMDCLGNPQSKFKAVHIAGTKGKGSTAAFLSNILRAEGYSVGCYTSPHILSIRERMSLGRLGQPVSAKTLNCLFLSIKEVLDQAIEHENGCLSHFEVLTAMAFTLFAQESVNFAVIEAGLGGARDATNVISSSGLAASVITTIGEEHLAALGGSLESIAIAKSGIIKHGRAVVLGGPFLPHIEGILRDKASLMSSPVLSASDAGISASIKGVSMFKGRPCQSCDIKIQVKRDFNLFCELFDVNLCMLGNHQLQNAVTAACVALCLRDQGWSLSDESIQAGLENTFLPGRTQFLTPKEAEALGLPGATILLDGESWCLLQVLLEITLVEWKRSVDFILSHTKESAKALMEMIQMMFPDTQLTFVVAMANDKDHLSFARELSGQPLEAVFLTEADIAGGKSRTTSPSLLRDCWIQASEELGIDVLHDGMTEYQELFKDQSVFASREFTQSTIVAAESSLAVSMRAADQILNKRTRIGSGIIVVTGSLHIVSAVLALLYHH